MFAENAVRCPRMITPTCESKMVKLDLTTSYEVENEDEEDDEFETIGGGDYGLDDLEEGLPNIA